MHSRSSQNVLFWDLTRPELDLFLGTPRRGDGYVIYKVDSRVKVFISLTCVKDLAFVSI